MKSILIIITLIFSLFDSVAQDFFVVSKNSYNNYVYKRREPEPKPRFCHTTGKFLLTFEGDEEKTMLRDFQKVLLAEFPNVSDEEYGYLKQILWTVYVYADGSCLHRKFIVPDSVYNNIPNIETHLYNLVQSIEKFDFTKYKIRYIEPGKEDEYLAIYVIPFQYMRMKIGQNQ